MYRQQIIDYKNDLENSTKTMMQQNIEIHELTATYQKIYSEGLPSALNSGQEMQKQVNPQYNGELQNLQLLDNEQ